MNTMQTSATKSLKHFWIPLQACALALGLFASVVASAGTTVKLAETQTEKLKCKKTECTKLSTGTYNATFKIDITELLSHPELLSEFGIASLIEQAGFDFSNGLDISKLTGPQIKALLSIANKINIAPETPLSLTIGTYSFDSTFGARINLTKKTSGTWSLFHPKAGYLGSCPNKKCVKDGSVSWSFGLAGIIISFSGNSDKVNNFGQSVFASACSAVDDKTVLSETALVRIGQANLEFPVAVTCGVKKPTTSLTRSGASFDIVNLKIKAN